MLSDNIAPKQKVIKGYKPLYSIMDYEPETADSSDETEADDLKLKYIEKLITEARQKGIKLIFIISPAYKAKSSDRFEAAKKIIIKEGMPLFDFYTEKEIGWDRSLFEDRIHLNDNGAHAFTEKIIPVLKEVLDTTPEALSQDDKVTQLTCQEHIR